MEKLLSFRKSQIGFTLIELLIVVSIIVIVMAVGASSYNTAQKRARDAQRQTDLKKIASALENYYGENEGFPNSIYSTTCLDDNGTCIISGTNRIYLDTVPKDPQGSDYKYCADQPNPNFGGKNQGFTLQASLETGSTYTLKDSSDNSTCVPS